MKLKTWLNNLEEDLKKLRVAFKIEEQEKLKQEKLKQEKLKQEKIMSKGKEEAEFDSGDEQDEVVENEDSSSEKAQHDFAKFYLDRITGAYIEIINILKPLASNPVRLVALLVGNDSGEKNNINDQLTEQVNKIDRINYVPHIFHPRYVEERGQFFLKSDNRCYLLANRLRDALRDLENNVEDNVFKVAKKVAGHKLAKIINTLESRMHLYEMNKKYQHEVDEVENELSPRLIALGKKVRAENISEEEGSAIVTEMLALVEKGLESPLVILQYLRDDPVSLVQMEKYRGILPTLAQEQKLAEFVESVYNGRDSYPYIIIDYCKTLAEKSNDLGLISDQMLATYFKEMDGRNVYYSDAIQRQLSQILRVLKSKDNLESYIAADQMKILESAYNELKQHVDDEYEKTPLGEKADQWVREIRGHISTLIKTFDSYKSYDSSARHPFTSKKKVNIYGLYRTIYDTLYPFMQRSQTRAEQDLAGAAIQLAFTDLLLMVKDHVTGFMSSLEDLGDQSSQQYQALQNFAKYVDSMLLDPEQEEKPVHEFQ